MATMTTVAVPNGITWTLIYTAGAGIAISVQNRASEGVLVRVSGSAGAVGDAPAAAAFMLAPLGVLPMTLANGDKVLCRAPGGISGQVAVLA